MKIEIKNLQGLKDTEYISGKKEKEKPTGEKMAKKGSPEDSAHLSMFFP